MSSRFGYETRSSGQHILIVDCWLTIARGSNGSDRPSLRLTAGYPALDRNERTINLKMELPIALFEAPSLSASIKVDHPAQAVTIDTTAVASAVRAAIGMDVDIAVRSPELEGCLHSIR